MVHADPVVERITFPEDEDPELRDAIVAELERITKMRGVFKGTPEALALIDRIYTRGRPLTDARLQAYHGRRLDHMLKLVQAVAACRGTHTVDVDMVEEANTILSYTEEAMGQALGELGDSRNARASQNIMNVLSNHNGPVHIDDLYKGVMQDVTRHQEFLEMLQNLEKAKKVMHQMEGGAMYYLLARTIDSADNIGVNKSKWLEEFAE
jgi:DNA replicative helicase MCM subunit Mcm2 (Cdc46/Mcm family)